MPANFRNCLIASLAVALSGVSNTARAQATVPGAAHDTPTRVLQIESVSGNVSLQRDSKSIAMQAGFLIFGEESLQLGDDASASFRLGRYGRLDLAALDGSAALVSEKLPFSSWATDLSTELRVDGGALHVMWRRPADGWPLTIAVGPWRSDLGAGEFLFRGDSKRASVCNVSGTMEVRYEGKGFRESLAPGQCFDLRDDDSPERVALVASHWNSLWSDQLVRVSDGAPVVSVVQLSPAESRVRREAESLRPIDAAERAPTRDTRQEPVVAAPPVQEQTISSPVTSPVPVQEELVVENSFTAETETLNAPAVPESAVVEQTFVPVPAPSVPAQAPVVEVTASKPEPEAEDSSSAAPAAQRESLVYRAPERSVVTVPSSDFSAGPDGPEWIINVMTVTSQETAMEHIQRLNNAGYPATLRSETVRSRASYRVIVPGIGSEAGAQRVVGQLKKKMGYSAAWALQKR